MLSKCPMFAVRLWITTSPYLWPLGSLPSTCMFCTPPRTALRTFTPSRDRLVICGQYDVYLYIFSVITQTRLRAWRRGFDSWKGQRFICPLRRDQTGCLIASMLIMITAMGWDYVSEIRPQTGLLFIPQMIHKHAEPWWNDDIYIGKLLTPPQELSGNPTSRCIW
jgi:hypothetical protein